MNPTTKMVRVLAVVFMIYYLAMFS
jgi:hypothetical protein